MFNKRLFELNLDIVELGKEPINLGMVKQYDGTTIKLFLRNKGMMMELKGCSASLSAKTSAGDPILQTADVEIDPVLGMVKFECKSNIFKDIGVVLLECLIVDDDGYQVTSPTMKIVVEARVNDLDEDDVIQGEDIDFMAGVIHEESARRASEAQRAADELVRGEQEIIRVTNEVMREISEEARHTNELERIKAIEELSKSFEFTEQDINDIISMVGV